MSSQNVPFAPVVALVNAPAHFFSDGVYFPRWTFSRLSLSNIIHEAGRVF
jgi:hypothetical protein